MKKVVLSTYSKILGFLFTLLGMNITCAMYGTPAEYGVPTADFKASGNVIASDTKKPIQNIRVIGKAVDGNADTAYTDVQGKYSVEMKRIIGFPVKIIAEDIDDTQNRHFKSDSLLIDKKDAVQIKKGDSWYDGAFEKKQADFTLVPMETIPANGVRSTAFKEMEQK